MKKVNLKRIMVSLILCISLFLVGCGTPKYIGAYIGNDGSVMVLEKDGTGTYKAGKWKSTEPCTWKTEDEKIIVSCEELGYDIYAEISDSTTGLMFQSDSSHWRDELFVKTEK